ncbi:MAG TPA: DUF1549 domain-containing protein, partial [Blastocatellia bacterium]|nr:DUF1549 domain-containing protein [Blastocatellia bacterium]
MRRKSISDAGRLTKITLVFTLLSGLASSQARAMWERIDRDATPVLVQAAAQEKSFRPVRTASESVPRAVASGVFVKDLINGTPFATARGTESSAQEEFFEKKVRPIFAANCQRCHNAKSKVAGLDLTTAEAFQRGGDSGPAINKVKPEESRLLKVIGYDGETKMPPSGKLKDHEIAALTEWVKMGAPWPGAGRAAASESLPKNPAARSFTEEEKGFWAYQPVRAMRDIAPPQVKDVAWAQSPIDRFILRKLEEKNLKPAPPADKLALLRRATFDLTGLPPTENEMRDFLADRSPDAFNKVVERLLASPRYGERWGRHWLDVARYADSTGNDEDHRYPHAWKYRDYVIESFNNDLPYDQFVREQIAGDLLPAKTPGEVNRRG